MRRGLFDGFNKGFPVFTDVFSGDDGLEVSVEVENGSRKISDLRFGNVKILEEDVVDVGVGVDGALWRIRG